MRIMDSVTQKAADLRQQIIIAEKELKLLKEQLAIAEQQEAFVTPDITLPQLSSESQSDVTKWPLSSEEYKRYGRQLIVPDIGIQGSSILENIPPVLSIDIQK